jgi:hypothetical protein
MTSPGKDEDDYRPITFYWPKMHGVTPDGVIEMRATGYDEEVRWTGVKRWEPDSPDYLFWRWIIDQQARFDDFFSDRKLPVLKEEFERTLRDDKKNSFRFEVRQ